MKKLASSNSIHQRIWLIAIMLSMLFVQSLQLHVHTYSHDAELLGHIHYDSVHSVFDITQNAHADEVAQLDMTQDGLAASVFTIPMLAILFSLLMVLSIQYVIHRGRHFFKSPHYRNVTQHFRPPLRAPPINS